MAKKQFYIPQVEDNEQEQEQVFSSDGSKTKYESEGFVSSLYGKNVKDNAYFHGVKYDNGGKQYNSFREKDKRTDVDDFKDYIINYDPNHTNLSNKQQNNINEEYTESIYLEDEYEDDIYEQEQYETEEYYNVKEVNEEQPVSYKPKYQTQKEVIKPNYEEERVNVIVDEEVEEEEVIEKHVRRFENRPTNNFQKQGNTQTNLNVKPKRKAKYIAPPLEVLKNKPQDSENTEAETLKQRDIIDLTLKQFDIGGHVVTYTKGPTVTQFEVQLNEGVRNQKIIPIQSNLQGNLKATSLRMQIPIPGKATIGIEVPNESRETVFFGDMISNKKFLNDGNPLNVVLGVNINGDPVYLDITKMPHGLVAGQTGSGKSVCINAIIASILYKAHPDDVKLILVDPKRVEFARYSGIPHLATPIITEPKMANAALKWVVDEMENRYRLFEVTGVTKYTEYLEESRTDGRLKHIPYIVVIIDELADLMVTSGPEVEESIMRITQKARAAGIHLIVATQRPSVNIISGTIKTNIPTRIAFKVNKAVDSSIILDHVGAEKLLGLGDMLYTDDMGVENRIQGAFISSSEIKQVVNSLEEFKGSEYLFTEEDLKKKTTVDHSNDAFEDELFEDIARYVVENNTASINLLQKKFSCGFSRIQTIIIKLGELGVVSENLGSRAREVLVTPAELEEILNNI